MGCNTCAFSWLKDKLKHIAKSYPPDHRAQLHVESRWPSDVLLIVTRMGSVLSLKL